MIDDTYCKSHGTTKTKTNYISPKWIQTWEDFNFESLKTMDDGALNEILKTHYPLTDILTVPPYPFCEIHDESSLSGLLVKWNQSIVSEGLAKAQDSVLQLTDEQVCMVQGGQAQRCGNSTRYNADWAGVLRSQPQGDVDKPPNMLPGDTKLGKKWHSSRIEQGRVSQRRELFKWLSPLTQVFTYCLRSEVRYGYIITDKELVVLRLRAREREEPDQQEQQERQRLIIDRLREEGVLEYRSIPWPDDGQMTVNLALWWIHLLAKRERQLDFHYDPLTGRHPSNIASTSFQSVGSLPGHFNGMAVNSQATPSFQETSPTPPLRLPPKRKRARGQESTAKKRHKHHREAKVKKSKR